jgi:hypothetical protein
VPQQRVLQNKDVGPTLMITDHDIPVISIQFGEQRRFFDMCDMKTPDDKAIRKYPTVDNAIH